MDVAERSSVIAFHLHKYENMLNSLKEKTFTFHRCGNHPFLLIIEFYAYFEIFYLKNVFVFKKILFIKLRFSFVFKSPPRITAGDIDKSVKMFLCVRLLCGGLYGDEG